MIFFVDFEIEVGTVEVCMRCIKPVHLFYLMVIDFNNLFVFAANIFKSVIKLVQRKLIRIKEFGNYFIICFRFRAWMNKPCINKG